MKDPFIQFLKTNKKKSFFLCAPPGNSGDTLLKKGLELYLAQHNFTITPDPSTADILMIHGGGNIDDVWSCGISLFQDIISEYPNKVIAVAPSTCHFRNTDFESILNDCTQNVHFFTREKNSYTRLKSMKLKRNIHVYLSHDTAFLLHSSEYILNLKKKNTNSYTLFAFRTDKESNLLPITLDIGNPHFKERLKKLFIWLNLRLITRKISPIAKHRRIIEDISLLKYSEFESSIVHASEIYTDRLHVAIFGALLGKDVFLHATKYDKIQGIYEQTLRLYPSVRKMF